MEREQSGPLDEPDEETACDPDSTVGDEDESGFDEMADWAEWQAVDDDGFDDAGESEDEDGEEDGDECEGDDE